MRLRSIVAAVAALGLVAPAFADEEEAEERIEGNPETEPEGEGEEETETRGDRTLAGHAFVPFSSVKWPFALTRFFSNTTLGLIELPVVARIGEGMSEVTIEEEGELVALGEEFTLELALAKWLAVEVGVLGTGVAGSNDAGSFLVGANGAYGGRFGVLFRLLELDRFYLSWRFDGVGLRTDGIIPSRLFDVSEEGGFMVDLTRLRVTGTIARGSTSLASALALASWLGLQVSGTAEIQSAEFGEIGDRTWMLTGAAGISLNFSSLGLPVAFLAGGRVDRVFEDDIEVVRLPAFERGQETTGEVEGGIYYSGREDFDLGIAGSTSVGSDVERFLGSIRFAYYW